MATAAPAAAAQRSEPESTFRILVTTDNHLGYMERDARRKNDSFIAFEEALQHGRVTHDCDLCILGGDLFHENKPPLNVLQRSIALFRKYTMGGKDVAFELRTDPAVNFPTHPLPVANFQDPNLNIAMPIFSIHGNHDDPTGGTSSIDILASAGLINYFGHVQHTEDIVVRPVILRKGRTQIALYGIGNVRDERFHRALKHGKVTFVKPAAGQEKFFNILVVHQNRGTRGKDSKNGVHDNMLGKFGMDLVIWGNEHEQIMGPTAIDGYAMDITQPGSTIHTSLNHVEQQPKACGILEVRGVSYNMRTHFLRNVRPIVRRIVALHQVQMAPGKRGKGGGGPLPKTEEAVEEFLDNQMQEMLEEAEQQIDQIPEDVLARYKDLKLPLVRLAVDFSDPSPHGIRWPLRNALRFGTKYSEVVANATDVLKEMKPSEREVKARARADEAFSADLLARGDGQNAMQAATAAREYNAALPVDDIRSKISDFLAEHAKGQCQLLAEQELSDAVYAFVEKGERHAVDEKISELVRGAQRKVWEEVRHVDMDQLTKPLVLKHAAANKIEVNRRFSERMGAVDDDDDNIHDDQLPQQRGNKKGAAVSAAAAGGGTQRDIPKGPSEELQRLFNKINAKNEAPRPDTTARAGNRRRDRSDPVSDDDKNEFDQIAATIATRDGANDDEYDDDDGDDDDEQPKRRAPAAQPGKKAKAAPKAGGKGKKGKKAAAQVDDDDGDGIPTVAAPAKGKKKAAAKWLGDD